MEITVYKRGNNMKRILIISSALIVLVSMSVTSLAAGLTSASVTEYLFGKKASATCYATGDANNKFVSVELYKNGETEGHMSYWDDDSQYTAAKVSASVSKNSSSIKNGYALAYMSTAGGNYIDHAVAGVRHG